MFSYLILNQAMMRDGSDFEDNVDPSGNRLYRYEYVDGRLKNPILLLDLTAIPDNGRGEHNGGKISNWT